VNKVTGNSLIENLHIQNWPAHCFSIQNSADLVLRNILLDNRAGDAPNNRSVCVLILQRKEEKKISLLTAV
jgi:polygalacturonase